MPPRMKTPYLTKPPLPKYISSYVLRFLAGVGLEDFGLGEDLTTIFLASAADLEECAVATITSIAPPWSEPLPETRVSTML